MLSRDHHVMLTCKRVDSNASTHLLEMPSELCILPDFRLVFCGKGFQLFPKGVQLPTDMGQLQLSDLRPLG